MPAPATTVHLESFGVSIELSGNDVATIAAVQAELPGARLRAPGREEAQLRYQVWRCGNATLVERDGERVVHAPREAALEALCSRLHFEVAVAAEPLVFLHAAAVVIAGRLVLFPGRTHAGKSTLAAALAASGATYYSDEYAPIGDGGRVWPFRRRLVLRDDLGSRLSKLAREGGSPPPLRCALIIDTHYDPAAQWRPRELTPGEASLRLLANAVPARRRPRETAAAIVQLLTSRPRVLSGPRGDFASFVPCLFELVTQIAGAALAPDAPRPPSEVR